MLTTTGLLPALEKADEDAAPQSVLRVADHLVDGATLPAGEPIPIWGTCADHGLVEVVLGDENLTTQTDSSGWWLVTFPARPGGANPLDLVIKSGREKTSVKGLRVAESPIPRSALRAGAPFQDHAVLQREKPLPVWGTAKAGATVEVWLGDEHQTAVADAAGRWKVTFAPRPASSDPLTLRIQSGEQSLTVADLLIGDVWLAGGQSNMEWVFRRLPEAAKASAQANFPTLRYFTGPDMEAGTPQSQRIGEWLVCSPSTVGDFSGAAYYFARALQEKLNIPIGLIDVNWGGTKIEPWTPPDAFSTEPELSNIARAVQAFHPRFDEGKAAQKAWLKAMSAWSDAAAVKLASGRTPPPMPAEPGAESSFEEKQSPSRTFNAMVAPIAPYSVRGAIWYQGESNAGDALYLAKKRALISGWRKIWGQDLPFYFVQLAAFNNGRPPEKPPFADHPWAVVRDAQRQALQIPHTGMAVAIDIGDDSRNPHAKNKRDVGERLARWALCKTYGYADIVPSGPLFERLERDGDLIRLRFLHTDGGLMTARKEGIDTPVPEPGKVRWISLKGPDGKWTEANAEIDGDTVIVHLAGQSQPQEIAYAWAGFPLGANLYNGAGLPASPFRAQILPQSAASRQ